MKSIQVYAFDIATSFDLVAMRPQAETWGKLIEHNPLIVEFEPSKFMVVFEYGSVVTFNFSRSEVRGWLDRLRPHAIRTNRREFTDNFTLYIGNQKQGTMTTEELSVRQFFLDTVKLVAIVLSRSVSLEYYEELIDQSLAKLETSVDSLSRSGRLVLKRRELLKQVGVALAIHHELAYNLQLLDDPDMVWDRGEEMHKLYQNLSTQFSIGKRAQVIERKLEIIARSNEFIIERLQDRTANIMEIGVITLFIIDLVLIFFELMK